MCKILAFPGMSGGKKALGQGLGQGYLYEICEGVYL